MQVLESPMPQSNLDWYVLLRAQSPFAIGLHLNDHAQVINAVKREATDVMNLNETVSEFVAMATTAGAAGIAIWHGSGVDLGLLDASYVHAAACAPTCTLGSDIVGHFIREHHLLRSLLQFESG